MNDNDPLFLNVSTWDEYLSACDQRTQRSISNLKNKKRGPHDLSVKQSMDHFSDLQLELAIEANHTFVALMKQHDLPFDLMNADQIARELQLLEGFLLFGGEGIETGSDARTMQRLELDPYLPLYRFFWHHRNRELWMSFTNTATAAVAECAQEYADTIEAMLPDALKNIDFIVHAGFEFSALTVYLEKYVRAITPLYGEPYSETTITRLLELLHLRASVPAAPRPVLPEDRLHP